MHFSFRLVSDHSEERMREDSVARQLARVPRPRRTRVLALLALRGLFVLRGPVQGLIGASLLLNLRKTALGCTDANDQYQSGHFSIC